jgi:hypothetical protein
MRRPNRCCAGCGQVRGTAARPRQPGSAHISPAQLSATLRVTPGPSKQTWPNHALCKHGRFNRRGHEHSGRWAGAFEVPCPPPTHGAHSTARAGTHAAGTSMPAARYLDRGPSGATPRARNCGSGAPSTMESGPRCTNTRATLRRRRLSHRNETHIDTGCVGDWSRRKAYLNCRGAAISLRCEARHLAAEGGVPKRAGGLDGSSS